MGFHVGNVNNGVKRIQHGHKTVVLAAQVFLHLHALCFIGVNSDYFS